MRAKHLAIVCVTILIAAAVFWPTIWRYGEYGAGANSLPMRTNRLTGEAQLMMPNLGWVSQTPEEPPGDLVALPDSDLVRVTGTAGFKYETSFEALVYNGSPWHIYQIEYEIAAERQRDPFADFAKGKNIVTDTAPYWKRTFRSNVSIGPLTTSRDFFSVGSVPVSAHTGWRILSAKGTR
jgi:hypothetical protein